VSARTFEYDSRPSANAAEIAGSERNACAVRTFSRAADSDSPQRHASQSAQLGKPHFANPKRSSKSRTSTSIRYVSAFICRASRRISWSKSSIEPSIENAPARVVVGVVEAVAAVVAVALAVRAVIGASVRGWSEADIIYSIRQFVYIFSCVFRLL
jgi:hypothetical protein